MTPNLPAMLAECHEPYALAGSNCGLAVFAALKDFTKAQRALAIWAAIPKRRQIELAAGDVQVLAQALAALAGFEPCEEKQPARPAWGVAYMGDGTLGFVVFHGLYWWARSEHGIARVMPDEVVQAWSAA